MQNNTSINLSTTNDKLNQIPKSSNLLITLSTIGPILAIIFLIIALPLLIEFYSIPGFQEKDHFSEKNILILTNLMFLLYAFSLASVFGLMLSLEHKKTVIIILNILSIIIGIGMFFPLLIAVIGDWS